MSCLPWEQMDDQPCKDRQPSCGAKSIPFRQFVPGYRLLGSHQEIMSPAFLTPAEPYRITSSNKPRALHHPVNAEQITVSTYDLSKYSRVRRGSFWIIINNGATLVLAGDQ